MRFVKKVNERGVLTLPNDIREAMGVEEGDIVEFEILGVVKKRNDKPTIYSASPLPEATE